MGGQPGVRLDYCKCSDTCVLGSLTPQCLPKAKTNERQGLFDLGHHVSVLAGSVKYN